MEGLGDLREKQDGPRNAVVIVEDDPAVRMQASELFTDAGIPTVDFANADAALSYIWHNASQVGALFTDIETPGHFGGAELAQIVTQRWKWIFVLITSGAATAPDCDGLQTQFVAKPWCPKDVLLAVAGALAEPCFGEQRDRLLVRRSSQSALM